MTTTDKTGCIIEHGAADADHGLDLDACPYRIGTDERELYCLGRWQAMSSGGQRLPA